jgi:hypothetical protein
MKLKSVLATTLLAALTSLSLSAQAASDTSQAPAAQPMAQGMPADKAMKPHSHMEQKTGIAPKASAGEDKKPDPVKDKNKHLHPRDGK